MIPPFTLVLGVDAYHLKQLSLTLPTWRKCKPSLFDNPIRIFYDREQVKEDEIRSVVQGNQDLLTTIPWPMGGVLFDGDGSDKWSNPQRAKMLSGFVYVPGLFVRTPYWMKLDTDVVATGQDDWIDEKWFEDEPAIVSHPWTFTRPPNQMLDMDRWVEKNKEKLPASVVDKPPLNLVPKEGSDRLGHRRIISWCSFFNTTWTNEVARMTALGDGTYKLPVPSQDGYFWYMATRMGRGIVRPHMKKLGWEHWSTLFNVERRSREVMEKIHG